MPPKETLRLAADAAGIAHAAELLRSGGTVAIPTETVYGLAANGLNAMAVERIFIAKGRPHWDPLILHVSDAEMLQGIATEITPTAQALMDAFWPGPLTLLLPRRPDVPDIVTAGRPLAGVRMPAHPVALAILDASGRPLAAPSANRFGHVSPTTAEHVLADLDGRIDAVVDAGPCAIGVESTVVDPSGPCMTVYRQGGISLSDLEQAAGLPARIYTPPPQGGRPESLPAPGVGIRHYAPRARVVLVESEQKMQHAAAVSNDSKTAVLLPANWQLAGFAGRVMRWADWADDAGLARTLYSAMRDLDTAGIEIILIPVPETVPNKQAGTSSLRGAIRDRLLKAAR